MLSNKTQFLFIVFLLFSFRVVASGPESFSVNNTSTFRFRYNPADGRSLNNFFIREIAKYNYLELYKTGYSLGFEQIVAFHERSKGSYEIYSSMVLKGMEGDIFYEGFNISGVLMPSAYSFDLLVFDKELKLLDELNLRDLRVSRAEDSAVYSLDLPSQTGLIFKITNVSFKYQETDKSNFAKQIVQVNEFLGFLDLSGNMVKKAGLIDPDEPGKILSNYLKIYDLERFSNIIARQNFNTGLAIPSNDSANYAKNLTAHAINLRRLQTIYQQNVDTLHTEIGDAELLSAAHEIINLQLGYIKNLDASNYLYQPVYLQMAEVFKNEKDWPVLLNEISSFFSTRTNISFPEGFEGILGRALYQEYLKNADSLIAHQKNNEAVLMLESAAVVCRNKPEIDCEVSVFNRLSTAKYGIYDAYLKIAGQALNKKNLDMAKNYLEMARDFQGKNRSTILTDDLTDRNFSLLAAEFSERGRQALKNGFAIEALNDLSAAQSIYQRLQLTSLNASIQKALETAFTLKFEELVKKVEKSLEINNLDKAEDEAGQIQMLADSYPEINFDKNRFEELKTTINTNRFRILYINLLSALRYERFDEAAVLTKKLRERYPESFRQSGDELAAYIKLYVKPVLLNKIDQAEKMLLTDNQKDTDQLVAEILKLKNNFPAFHDDEVEDAFAGLMKKFETGECGSLKSSIARQTDQAIQLIGIKMYDAAGKIVDQALLELQSGKNCNVNDSILKSLKNNYNDIFTYYALLRQADEKFGKSDFLASIEIHLKAENFFYQQNVYRFDETYQSIEEFLTAKASPGLNSTAIGYFSRKQDYRKMISLFHLYLGNGYDIAKYNSYLREAGTFMAAQDKARFPQSDPVFMLEKLTLGKQDFQPFKSAYLKAWKNKN